MKFEEVLPALREGKKVRLGDWNEDEYIRFDDNKTLIDRYNFLYDAPICCVISREDWEVVKPIRYARIVNSPTCVYVVVREHGETTDDLRQGHEWIGDWVELPEGTS